MAPKTEIIVCPFCTENLSSFYEKINDWTVVKCTNCNGLYTNPRPKEEHLASFYTRDYFESDRFQSYNVAGGSNRAKAISKHKKKPGRILEIGSAKGHFLEYMKNNGWQVEGVELSLDAATFSKEEFNLSIFNGDFLNYKVKDNFDVIAMYQVLEHVSKPKQILSKIHQSLNSGGIAIIEVPNMNGFDMKIDNERKRWSYDLPLHLTHYTPSFLKKTMEREGFKVLEIDRYYPNFIINYFYNKFKKAEKNTLEQKDKKTLAPASAPIGNNPEETKLVVAKEFVLKMISYIFPGWRFTVIAQKR